MDKFFFTIDGGTGILTAGQLLGQLPDGCMEVEFDDFRTAILYWLAMIEPEGAPPMGSTAPSLFAPTTAIDHELFGGMGPATVKTLDAGGIKTLGHLSESSYTAIRAAGVKIIRQAVVESWVSIAKELVGGD